MLQINLAAARVNAGFTQKHVAKELKVSNKTLANWENGRAKPSFSTLQALAQLYNIPVDNLKCQFFKKEIHLKCVFGAIMQISRHSTGHRLLDLICCQTGLLFVTK